MMQINELGPRATDESAVRVDRMVDGLVFSCDGWSEALAESDLSAIHVTVSDFLADFAETCEGIASWNAILDRDAGHLYRIQDSGTLRNHNRRDGLGVIYGLQNAYPVDSSLDRVEQLWQLGIRVMQLTYNTANQVADGCLEERNGGLTRFGRDLVRECNRVGMVVDLSHVGERACLETVEITSAPVVATHVNFKALSPNPRNKSESVLKAIADTDGFVGVSPYGPMCWDGQSNQLPAPVDFLRHLDRAVELFGIDRVAVGTDYGVAQDMRGIDRVLARSVERFPEVFGEYSASFGNTLSSRYCQEMSSVSAWAGFPALLAAHGCTRIEINRILGGTIIDVFGRVWDNRGSTASGGNST